MFHVEQTHTQLLAQPKDHLVSGERFEIRLDVNTHVAATHPRPTRKTSIIMLQTNTYHTETKTLTDQLYRLSKG